MTEPQSASNGTSPNDAPTAINIDDPTVLRPDFYQTTKAGGERQRLALACQICRQKKVKCNGELPKCGRCVGLNLECVYKLTTHRRRRNPTTQQSRPEELEPVESPSDPINLQPAFQGMPSLDVRIPKALSLKRHRTGSSVGSASLDSSLGPDMASRSRVPPTSREAAAIWSQNRPGTSERLQNPDLLPRKALTPSQSEYGRCILAEPLPPHKLLIDLCQTYFTKVYGQMYAFLHPPSFMRTVVEAPKTINPALLLAIAAVSSRFHTTAQPGVLKPNLWATACTDIIFGTRQTSSGNSEAHFAALGDNWIRENLSSPSVSCVQALSTVSYYYFGQGQASLAWVVSGFAVRLAYALHLNLEFYDDPIGFLQNQPPNMTVTFTDREIRRRTFWALYIMDRLNSAGEHRPFTIRNEEVSIQLPVSQTRFEREMPAITATLDGRHFHNSVPTQDPNVNMDCGAWIIRIVDIWGETTRFVQEAPNSVVWGPESPLMIIRARANTWVESLPPALRYENGITRQQPAGWYIMHIAYHLALCTMQRFALPKSSNMHQYSVENVPVGYLNMCVKEAIYNASKISEIIQTRPPNVKLSAPFMGFAAFSAATFHAFLGFHVHDMDPASTTRYRGYVYSTLEFLHDLGQAWQPLSKMHDALASQINSKHESIASHRSSILHDTPVVGAARFRVPESSPNEFSLEQQVQMNTLAFSNWFHEPATQNFSDSAGPRHSQQGLIDFSGRHEASSMYQKTAPNFSIEHPQNLNRCQIVTPLSGYQDSLQDAPAGKGDNDTAAADLLVSFKQSEYLGGKTTTSGSNALLQNQQYLDDPARQHSILNDLAQDDIPADLLSEYQRTSCLDFLGNLKEHNGSGISSSVDILQLMKLGLITSQNWA